eukprot:414197_1
MTTEPTVPPSKFDGRHRRKFRRACCCITFLLLLNALLLIQTSHSIGGIMWFMMNGSYTFHDTTYLFVPGGAKTLCNDLCVDMCIYKDVNCEINSCLNVCNEKLIEDGNPDDFNPLPENTHPMIMDEEMTVVDDIDTQPKDDTPLVLVDTPPTIGEYQVEPDTLEENGEEKLGVMQDKIEAVATKVRELKDKYMVRCGDDPELIGCNLTKETISELIGALKTLISRYDTYAVSIQMDIKVSVWMVDVDDVTAEP